jgi:hypothetical protein
LSTPAIGAATVSPGLWNALGTKYHDVVCVVCPVGTVCAVEPTVYGMHAVVPWKARRATRARRMRERVERGMLSSG